MYPLYFASRTTCSTTAGRASHSRKGGCLAQSSGHSTPVRLSHVASAFCVADLLSTPTRFRHRFELVAEVCTIQSMDPAQREVAAAAITSLLGPRGVLVAVARGRDDHEPLEEVHGPPWPLTRGELTGLMEASGLKPSRAIDDFMDDKVPPQRTLRGVFEHA